MNIWKRLALVARCSAVRCGYLGIGAPYRFRSCACISWFCRGHCDGFFPDRAAKDRETEARLFSEKQQVGTELTETIMGLFKGHASEPKLLQVFRRVRHCLHVFKWKSRFNDPPLRLPAGPLSGGARTGRAARPGPVPITPKYPARMKPERFGDYAGSAFPDRALRFRRELKLARGSDARSHGAHRPDHGDGQPPATPAAFPLLPPRSAVSPRARVETARATRHAAPRHLKQRRASGQSA